MIRFILSLMFLTSAAFANPIRVAIIDTGAPKELVEPCDDGHKDFTHTGLLDTVGHATNVSNVIDRYASGADYCQIYLKFFYPKNAVGDNLKTEIEAIKEAVRLKVDVINISAGGYAYSEEEKKIVKKALDSGIFVFAAAGNDNVDFDTQGCTYYPACLDERIVVVGCKVDKKMCTFSNHGKKVSIYANGEMVKAGGYQLSGTSQSTATMTGKFIKFWDDKRKKRK